MSDVNAVIILGGGLKKDDTGKWRTTTFDEGDNFGIDGSRLRVLAGAHLFKDNLDQLVIASGGKGQLKDIKDAPCVSEVIRAELIGIGVNSENIVTETESGNTYEQLQKLKDIIQERGIEHAIIISNKYHLPRIEAMIEQDEEFKGMMDNIRIETQSAEKILIEHEPKWEQKIESAYNSEAMRKREALEQKGVQDIKKEKYKVQ